MIVISFYTLDTPYEEMAKELIASCQRFEIPYSIEGIASRGSWEQNCAYKPSFILQKLKEHKRPVVWVDADARLQKKPAWEEFCNCDLAVRINTHFHKKHNSYLMTGTLFVNYTPSTLQLMEEWQRGCEAEPSCWDQVILARLLEKNIHLHIKPLPLPYIKVQPWDEGLVRQEETIIEHGQASRSVVRAQEQEFQKRKRVWRLGGIVNYRPDHLRQAADCFQSLAPFTRSLVVIMGGSSSCTEEERHQFAFLARYFPAALFVEIAPHCSFEMSQFLAKANMESEIERYLTLSADTLVNTEAMIAMMFSEAPHSVEAREHILIQPWVQERSDVNIIHHPLYTSRLEELPSNLLRIDETKWEQMAAARHLGIPMRF